MHPEFLVVTDPDQGRVEAWATARLPFEPKKSRRHPWLTTFRDELRNAIAGLTGPSGGVIRAVLASEDANAADTENVLFYNVGLDVFARIRPRTVAFKRLGAIPTPPQPCEATTYHRYELAESDEPPLDGPLLTSWSRIPLGLAPTVFTVWLALKQAAPLIEVHRQIADADTFTLEVELESTERASSVHLLKPVFDGVISAFHLYVGGELDLVSARLAHVLQGSDAELSALLTDQSLNVLGPRRVLWPRRDRLQWNPADERCSAGTLTALSGEMWSISGRIRSQRPKTVGRALVETSPRPTGAAHVRQTPGVRP